MRYIFFLLLFFISCGNHRGIDRVNAYEFEFDGVKIFNEYAEFIEQMGLPEKLEIFHENASITSKEQLDTLITYAFDGGVEIVWLNYPGFVTEVFDDYRILPQQFDFRKTDKGITFKNNVFNREFTIKDFQQLFPVSGNISLSSLLTMFSLVTKEELPNLEHFIVERESVDVSPFEESCPTIEFTFQNGKLIFMFFANF